MGVLAHDEWPRRGVELVSERVPAPPGGEAQSSPSPLPGGEEGSGDVEVIIDGDEPPAPIEAIGLEDAEVAGAAPDAEREAMLDKLFGPGGSFGGPGGDDDDDMLPPI